MDNHTLEQWRNRRHAQRVSAASGTFTVLALIQLAGQAFAQTPLMVPPPNALKKLSLDELQAIEVTSVSRHREKLSETASAIQVITADDIRRSGATSLPEALRLASNLTVAQIDSRQWAITARGFNGTSANKLLVLIDGRAVYTPLYAGVFWDAQDTLLEDIDRIEVISGPGATLWGANAVNGVINISTRRAKDSQGLLVTGSAGSALVGSGGLRYGGTLGASAQVRVYGKYFDRDNSRLPVGQQATDAWHMGQGGFRLDRDASPVDRVTVQGDFYDGRAAQLATSHVAVSGGNMLARWSHTMSPDSDLSLQVYYDRTDRNIPGSFAEALDTYDADFQQHVHVAGRNDVVWGLGYRVSHDHVGTTPALAILPPNVSHQWFSGFVQDELPLWTDRLHLSLGTKIEHNDYTGVEVQPGVRLGWTLTPQHMLWGAISRAVRTPSRIDRDFFVPATAPFLLAGGPGFVSEQLLAYELGYRTQPHDRLSLTVAAFYNDYDDIRGVEPLSPASPVPFVIANGQMGTSYGAELTADYRVREWWRLRSGYTGLRIHLRPTPGSTDRTYGSTESHDPNHQAFLRQSLNLPGHVELDAALRYVASIANQTVPAYEELDAHVAWQASPALEYSIIGQNLLHPHHIEFGAPDARREVMRGISAKITWRF
jgi:iron complex outermembrane receptor protein